MNPRYQGFTSVPASDSASQRECFPATNFLPFIVSSPYLSLPVPLSLLTRPISLGHRGKIPESRRVLTRQICVCVTTRERVFLGSSVFLGLQGRCPIVYGRISRTVTIVLRRRMKAGAAERASLGEGKGRGRSGINCQGKGSIRERVWEILGFVEGSEVEREARGTGALGDRARTDVALGPEQIGRCFPLPRR